MTDRSIIVKGPFTEDETLGMLHALTTLVQRIEQQRPGETFQVLLDAPDLDTTIAEVLAKIPVAPGYERVTREIVR